MNEESNENKTTDDHKGLQESPLGAVELDACRMWFEGFTSKEIEVALKATYGEAGVVAETIRKWFATGGKLEAFYKEYAETEAKIRFAETRNMFRAHVKNAVRVLVQMMNNKDEHPPSRVNAAKEIIYREMGQPLKVVADASGKTLARNILESAGLYDDDEESNEDNQPEDQESN